MAKTKMVQVVNGRMHFKCHACQAKRMVSIPPGIRRRSFRCHKCGETTHCNFNRRRALREQQRGVVQLTTNEGKTFNVNLFDISLYGVGFDVSFRDKHKLSVGSEIKFRCPWNPRLLSQGRYQITSLNGLRAGAQKRR